MLGQRLLGVLIEVAHAQGLIAACIDRTHHDQAVLANASNDLTGKGAEDVLHGNLLALPRDWREVLGAGESFFARPLMQTLIR